ncbi:LOW QUALITY PROTEIN: stathmin domain-containing protein 1 [Rhea pennata]|uniref:LOW QUALITY PROTEIN: stathmin domain-containing protein 1 n=1 Tax=Rhea pennata TaxID=8795 RepID=UPI002E2676B4
MVIMHNQAPKEDTILQHFYSLDLQQGEADGHSFAIGCNTFNRLTVAQLSSEELENKHKAKTQKDSHLPQKSSNAQSPDAFLTNKFIGKSGPLQERGRQKSDVLEELSGQGIIKSQSTTAGTGEVLETRKTNALEKALRKSPAKQEKSLKQEVGDFTVKDRKPSAEEKNRKEELNKRPQHTAFFSPATTHQTTGKQTGKDYPSFVSQEAIESAQPSPLGEYARYASKEGSSCSRNHNYVEDLAIESDITYNCLTEITWIYALLLE